MAFFVVYIVIVIHSNPKRFEFDFFDCDIYDDSARFFDLIRFARR